MSRQINDKIDALFVEGPDDGAVVNALVRKLAGVDLAKHPCPTPGGVIVNGRHGIWMWPDNMSYGDLEVFVAGIIPQSATLSYAVEACRIAKTDHAAEFEHRHARKAALKVRSVWRDASAAGGYGHLVRNLTLTPTPASDAFLAWFTKLFLA